MKKLQFKTTINCGSCVKTVSNFLNDVPNIKSWEVDTQNPDKILTVEGDNLNTDTIIETVEDAGFDIQAIQ